MQARAELRRLARPRTALLLSVVLVVSSLFLFTLFASEPYFFSWPRGTALDTISTGNSTEAAARDITTRLNPAGHRHRENDTLSFDWFITKGYRYPDGVGKEVYLVNGQFPGPNIEARSGDSVIIHVHNQLDQEGVSLHFHGLHMRGSNRMDGVVGVTQKAIPSGQNFTYSFQISSSQSGTFWWHAHSEVQRADGLFGALIVHEPLSFTEGADSLAAIPDEYGEDILLLVGDWYHLTATEVQASYDTYEYWGMEPVPDSLLINGLGAFNCSMAIPARPLDCLSLPKPRLKPGASKSRLRIINVGAMSGITFRIPGRTMSLIAVDGGNRVSASTPSTSGIGILYPGERVDVVVDWKPSKVDGMSSQDRFEISLDRENFQKKNLALTPDQAFPLDVESALTSRSALSTTVGAPAKDVLDLRKVDGQELVSALLSHEPSEVVLVYTRVEILAHLGNAPKGYINRTYWEPQETPLVDMDRAGWDSHQLVPLIQSSQNEDAWVDIIINNVDEKGHPFHLHGYDFYVVSDFKPTRRGWFAFNPYDTTRKPAGGDYNVVNPRKKDTIFIAGGGYVVLRIKPDNPGLWFLHCHILWHQAVGMAMTLHVV